MAVVRPRHLHLQPLVQNALAGVNANREQRRFHAVVLRRVFQVGHIRTAAAFNGKDAPVPPVLAEPQHFIGEVSAAVHAGRYDLHRRTVRLVPRSVQKLVKVFPHRIFQKVAVNLLVAYAPAFLSGSPSHDLHFKAVILRIYSGSQHYHIVRHIRLVGFAPSVQVCFLHGFALFCPRLAQLCVDPCFHQLRVSCVQLFFRFQKLLYHFIPAAKARAQRCQVESPRRFAGAFCYPLSADHLFFPVRLTVGHAAPFANVLRVLRVLRVKFQVRPHQRLVVSAAWAGDFKFFLRAVFKLHLYAARLFQRRCAHKHLLFIPECRLPLFGKR